MNEQTIRNGPPDRDPRATAVLFLAAIRQTSTHFGTLLRLARTEIRGNLRSLAFLAGTFGGALLLVVVSLVLLLLAARDALAALIGNEALAALIVALPFIVATMILTRAGLKRMSPRPIEP